MTESVGWVRCPCDRLYVVFALAVNKGGRCFNNAAKLFGRRFSSLLLHERSQYVLGFPERMISDDSRS